MRVRWIVNSLVMLLVLGGLFLDIRSLQPAIANTDEKIGIDLLDKLSTQGQADFIVRFVEQPDLSAAYDMNWTERGEYVVQVLQETAQRSQVRAKGILEAAGMKYQTFIAGNELYVWKGNLATAGNLAGLPEIESIRETRTYSILPIAIDPNPYSLITWAGDLLTYNLNTWVGESPTALTWGISATNANDFWEKFGYQGEGIIVANIDTGVQWNHPGLDQAFRCGTNPSDPKCWYDPTGLCGGSACDNHGHGTHTMGTMISDDDPTLPYQAGMAPGAKWIACKGCAYDDCNDYTLNSCADWILAPGGSSANRPHVVNNSWGGEGGNNWFETKVLAWRAAGIFPSFPSGNDGSQCSTIDSPGDYQSSFASAAHDARFPGVVASFSSRGPSVFGHDPYTKPNITAPGVDIMSTLPNSTWGRSSGTSMATPHSSGAVALLWSCNPSLIGQVDATFKVLQNTAWLYYEGNCSFPPDLQGNYTYGYGYLDVLAAGLNYCSSVATGTLEGYVYDSVSGEPIEGALVGVSPSLTGEEDGSSSLTDPSGFYKMKLSVGSYSVTASENGYSSETNNVTVSLNSTTQQDFHLDWIGEWMSGPTDPTDFYRYDCAWFDDGTGLSSYNQKIYCMGGRTGGSPLPAPESPEIWRFDAATQLFANTGDSLYEDVSNYAVTVLKDQNGWAIYVIGGFDADNTLKNVDYIQRYDPESGSVDVINTDPVPVKIGGVQANPGACVVAQSKIYCFGGFVSGTAPYVSVETWEYDPYRQAGQRWDRIESADLAVGRGYIQAAVQGDIIYAMGGISSFIDADWVATSEVEALDVNDLSAGWWAIAPLPLPTAEGRGFGFRSDKLYVVGGGDWPAETNDVFEYDVSSGTWSDDFPALQVARRDHAGVFVPLCTEDPTDGMPGMWVFGGRSGTDDPPYQEPEFYPMPCSNPTPIVNLTKTVGLDPGECASTKRLEIAQESEVTYCFKLYNNSPLTMTTHDLKDSNLGNLLDNFAYTLAPGESFFITETVTIRDTTFNVATWTAFDSSGMDYTAYDYASVIYQDNYYSIILPVNFKEY